MVEPKYKPGDYLRDERTGSVTKVFRIFEPGKSGREEYSMIVITPGRSKFPSVKWFSISIKELDTCDYVVLMDQKVARLLYG